EVCKNIEGMGHAHEDEKARTYAKQIEKAVPINEMGMKEQEGLFKLGTRGLVHYLIDQHYYEYKEKKKSEEEFEGDGAKDAEEKRMTEEMLENSTDLLSTFLDNITNFLVD
ncbi:hypothetical protein PENTCL1PPCAC_5875, partial [Pristionchus entomophagus]